MLAGDAVADGLAHPLGTLRRASAPADVVGVPLDLPFPFNGEQSVHPLFLEHVVHRLYERRFVADLTFATPSRWHQGR